MRSTILYHLLATLLGFGLFSFQAKAAVRYRLDFEGTWSATTHPGAFPGGSSHFTDLVGATHSEGSTFWEPGQLATLGVERVAELGSSSTFLSEVQVAINSGTAASKINGPSLFGLPASESLTVTVTELHPLVTLVSMVAPSPDWFVGVTGLSLRENGQWLGQVEVELDAYDAGTEDGEGFSLSNPATNPQEVIKKITTAPFAGLPPLAKLTFTVLPNDLAGDFNLDGQVDVDDSLIWQAGYGNFSGGGALVVDGDANGDGIVNGSDFLSWQQNFGKTLTAPTPALTVPEAKSLALLLVALLFSLAANFRYRLSFVEAR